MNVADLMNSADITQDERMASIGGFAIGARGAIAVLRPVLEIAAKVTHELAQRAVLDDAASGVELRAVTAAIPSTIAQCLASLEEEITASLEAGLEGCSEEDKIELLQGIETAVGLIRAKVA